MVVAQKDRDRSQERTMRLPDDGSLSETGTRVNLRFGKRLEKNGIPRHPNYLGLQMECSSLTSMFERHQ